MVKGQTLLNLIMPDQTPEIQKTSVNEGEKTACGSATMDHMKINKKDEEALILATPDQKKIVKKNDALIEQHISREEASKISQNLAKKSSIVTLTKVDSVELLPEE